MAHPDDLTRRTLLKGAAGGAALAGLGMPAIVKAQSDVIRIGHDEFRFYADAAPAPAPMPPRAAPAEPIRPPTGAGNRLSDTLIGLPPEALKESETPTPVQATPAVLPIASILVRTGSLRGRRMPIRAPVVNVGRADFNDMLRAHARQLQGNPNMRVRLEGHADERGSREYNIALGERRAQAVRQVLQLQGASSTQLSTVSYGEERPAELGHDETSWEKNRRVELVYAN